jgi:ABC-type dipeptide/oligopeptide/nickel transport system ATPase component
MEDLLAKISKMLIRGTSVALVGASGSGKTHWINNVLIPKLQKERTITYFKDGDDITDAPADIYIFDEVETLFDREFMENRHPDENPYYTESYLSKIYSWHEKYKKFDKTYLYSITRNELPEIENLVQNFKRAEWNNKEIETICFSPYLYHGSTTSGIKVLEPSHRYSPAGKIEYNAIYATPMKAYAAAHSFPWSSDEGVNLDVVEGKVIFAVPQNFRERLQVPISIYKVSLENFVHTKEEETGRTWHTTQATPVLEEEKYKSVAIALQKLGVELSYI